jgi:hypothetical protein
MEALDDQKVNITLSNFSHVSNILNKNKNEDFVSLYLN